MFILSKQYPPQKPWKSSQTVSCLRCQRSKGKMMVITTNCPVHPQPQWPPSPLHPLQGRLSKVTFLWRSWVHTAEYYGFLICCTIQQFSSKHLWLALCVWATALGLWEEQKVMGLSLSQRSAWIHYRVYWRGSLSTSPASLWISKWATGKCSIL